MEKLLKNNLQDAMLLKLRSRKKRVLTKCVKILDGHTISRRRTETEILLQRARETVLNAVYSRKPSPFRNVNV